MSKSIKIWKNVWIGEWVTIITSPLWNVEIWDYTWIVRDSHLLAQCWKIVIGKYCSISRKVAIMNKIHAHKPENLTTSTMFENYT